MKLQAILIAGTLAAAFRFAAPTQVFAKQNQPVAKTSRELAELRAFLRFFSERIVEVDAEGNELSCKEASSGWMPEP